MSACRNTADVLEVRLYLHGDVIIIMQCLGVTALSAAKHVSTTRSLAIASQRFFQACVLQADHCVVPIKHT